jgi:hypothetical protein
MKIVWPEVKLLPMWKNTQNQDGREASHYMTDKVCRKTEEVSLLLILAISNVLCITANFNCMFVGT